MDIRASCCRPSLGEILRACASDAKPMPIGQMDGADGAWGAMAGMRFAQFGFCAAHRLQPPSARVHRATTKRRAATGHQGAATPAYATASDVDNVGAWLRRVGPGCLPTWMWLLMADPNGLRTKKHWTICAKRSAARLRRYLKPHWLMRAQESAPFAAQTVPPRYDH